MKHRTPRDWRLEEDSNSKYPIDLKLLSFVVDDDEINRFFDSHNNVEATKLSTNAENSG